MNTVTLSLEDYNELKSKADAFNQITKESYSIEVMHTLYESVRYNVLNGDQTAIRLNEQIERVNEKLSRLQIKIYELEKDKSLWQRLFK